jgi:hypothetical protein
MVLPRRTHEGPFSPQVIWDRMVGWILGLNTLDMSASLAAQEAAVFAMAHIVRNELVHSTEALGHLLRASSVEQCVPECLLLTCARFGPGEA